MINFYDGNLKRVLIVYIVSQIYTFSTFLNFKWALFHVAIKHVYVMFKLQKKIQCIQILVILIIVVWVKCFKIMKQIAINAFL